MASLMEGDGGGGDNEQDLFGDVPIDDEPPLAAPAPVPAVNDQGPLDAGASIPPPVPTTQGQDPMMTSAPPPPIAEPPAPPETDQQPQMNGSVVPDAAAVAPAPPSAPAPAPGPSLLSKSGLLGMAGDTGGDDSGGGLFDAVDEEEKQKEEAERRAREEEERKRREAEEEEAARLKQLQEEEAEKKRQQEERMRQEHHLRQQQQQQQQQQYGQQSAYGMQQQPPQQQPMYQPQQQPYGGANGQPSPMQQSGLQQPPQQQPMYQQQQQQQSAMMQSTVMTPQIQQQQDQQQQLNSQMNNMQLNSPMAAGQPNQAGFYRDHQQMGGPPQQIQTGPSNAYGGGGVGAPGGNSNYYYGTQQQPSGGPMPSPQQRQPHQPGGMMNSPNPAAGMHNPANMGQVRKIIFQKPQDVPPMYTDIKVSEPMLIQNASFLISSPPYWSYQITSVLNHNQGTWLVRRRFRHVVALEDRMRQACPGSILPPRPDKHATRALEEASTQQSAEFAMHRAKELESYLKALAKHPVAGQSNVLRLFLGLQDDIGTAWAEVSTNAFTRLGAVGAEMSMKVAETTNLSSASAPAHEWEDNAELLALASSENVRMGAVSQAVPKLEGAVTLLREHGDAAGAVGMELSKIGKSGDDFKACEVLSNAMLRNGRRTKRLALELSSALDSFLNQYKLVRYEKMAIQDRRAAIQRRGKERRGADSRAYALAQQQRQLAASGRFDQLQNLEQSAVYGDQHALDVGNEADEVGARLKSEIHRVAISRRKEWNKSMKTVAKSMKEAATEQRAIWEATLETLQQQFSDMSVIQDTNTIVA